MARRFLIPLALVLVLGTTAVACSSDDSASDTTSTTAASTTTAPPNGSDDGVTVTKSGPIDLKVGERATIELEANQTTGYQWAPTAEPDAAVVTVVSDTYVAPETDRVGAGGSQKIVIEGVAPGTTSLAMGYSRPWEQGTPPAETATFQVTVS